MASVDKRSNGKYLARWREYPGGPQKSRQFSRKVDADQFLVEVQHRLLSGTYTPPAAGQMTLAAYAGEWLGRRSWAPSTHDRIARELRRHILPTLGDRPLSSLRRAHVEEWAKALPLAASSARMVYETLSNLLSAAATTSASPATPPKAPAWPGPRWCRSYRSPP